MVRAQARTIYPFMDAIILFRSSASGLIMGDLVNQLLNGKDTGDLALQGCREQGGLLILGNQKNMELWSG
ncbi:MAG: hypothetical protein U5J63_12520 [Fodinibius sp.]|nr:hypothetical protein [Fodinibius sp.]